VPSLLPRPPEKYGRWLTSILIASTLLLNVADRGSAASGNPRQNQHKEQAQEHLLGVQPRESEEASVPLSVFETAQAALADALHAVKAAEEITEKHDRLQYEPWYAPAVLAQFGLIIVGLAYAIVGWRQARFMKDATGAAERSANASEQALSLQFRPRLIVRNLIVHPTLEGVGDRSPDYYFVRNEFVRGQFFVANVGNSRATITESFCNVYWMKGPLPMRWPYEGLDGNNPILGTIEAGGRKTAIFSSTEAIPVGHTEIGLMNYHDFNAVWSIYVMGWIEYRDNLGFERRTSFCRKFEPTSNRFVAVDDPDYEIVE
jgi:hypothetical protein